MLHRAVEHVGHGLEAAVRVVGRALRLARAEIDRAHVVEEQERVDLRERRGRERPAHLEPAALELADRGDDRLHRALLVLCSWSLLGSILPLQPPFQPHPIPVSGSPNSMDALDFYGLQRTEDPNFWRLPVVPTLCSGLGALFGGCGLGACVEALERVTGRPLVWATGQYLSYARPPSVMDIRITEVVRGHQISQARAAGHASTATRSSP